MGALRNLLPLIVLVVVVAIAAFVGYQIYLWSDQMANRGKKHMEKKHVSFSKDGMKVGVKNINEEEYADRTQNILVKTWNASSFPAYKSRFWNTEATTTSSSRPQPSSQRPVSKNGVGSAR